METRPVLGLSSPFTAISEILEAIGLPFHGLLIQARKIFALSVSGWRSTRTE